MEGKTVSQSAIELAQVVMPADANHYGYVHGGTIVKLVDEAAFAVATRHAHRNVVTACIDRMSFEAPVRIGDLLLIKASLNYVGSTSMEVGVRVDTERLKDGTTVRVGSAYLTVVALDDQGIPTRVPPLILESEDDRRRNREAAGRREQRVCGR